MSPLDASTLNLSSSFSSEWTRASSILSDEESTAQDAKKCRMDSEDDGREVETSPTRTLRVYSSFSDNFQGSGRISQLLDSTEHSLSSQALKEVEFHAYYLPPDDLPISSFCNLLDRSTRLERLGIFHLRLDQSNVQWFAQIVRSIATLKHLRELTWDPLPACLWGHQLLDCLSHLPGLQKLHLTMDSDQFSTPFQEEVPQAVNAKPLQMRKLMQTLVSFRLSNCSLGWGICQMLAAGLRETETLEHLDLSSCFLVEMSRFEYVLDGLAENECLTHLDLTNLKVASLSTSQDAENNGANASPRELICQRLVKIVEAKNTTLQVVKGLSRTSQRRPPTTSEGSNLHGMLAINKNHVRIGILPGNPSSWHHLLQKISSCSPSITHQVLCQNLIAIASHAEDRGKAITGALRDSI